MYKRLLIAGLISVLPLGVSADFQFELDGGFGSGELSFEYEDSYFYNDDEDFDTKTISLSGKAYLESVSSDGVPFREAGFLSKKSSVSVTRNVYSVEFSSYEVDVTSDVLSGRFVGSSMILGAGFVQGGNDYSNYYDDFKIHRNGFILEVGTYLTDNSAIWLDYEKVDYDGAWRSSKGEKIISLNFKKVSQLGENNHLAWYLMAEHFDGRDFIVWNTKRTSVGGGVKWYFNQKFGVGAGLQVDQYSPEDDSDANGAVFTPEVSYDFSESFGVYLKIRSEALIIEDDFYDDEDEDVSDVTTVFGITARF